MNTVKYPVIVEDLTREMLEDLLEACILRYSIDPRGVNPVWFFNFWSKPGTKTWVPRFLVFGNQNWELVSVNRGLGYRPVPVYT